MPDHRSAESSLHNLAFLLSRLIRLHILADEKIQHVLFYKGTLGFTEAAKHSFAICHPPIDAA
jgi:hypothetical protein